MNELFEITEFLYYSAIFFIVMLFFSLIIDVVINKFFNNTDNKYILIEIFLMWISISVVLFYSKKLLYNIPNPFGDDIKKNNHINLIMVMTSIPLIIGLSVSNIKNKTQILHKNFENLFLNFD